MPKRYSLCLLGLLLICPFFFLHAQKKADTQEVPAPFDPAFYQGLSWRNIGPFRGGRSVAVSGVPGQQLTYYMGSTGGGVWKTQDAGMSWQNISDGFFKVGSIGAIAVAPSDPNVIYVGTGEHAVRGVMTSHGDGVYRSDDAGKTWRHIGLHLSRHIAAVHIHPQNPEIVYVAVQGAVHGPTIERGIYKSEDGGEHWERILFVNETTGCSDLSMDPSNPRILYAATWDHLRTPWQVRSGGPGSALYKSVDAGQNWTKLTEGLPADMGKTAIDVSPANPNIVYANIEAKAGGVFRSDDAGKSWRQTTGDRVTIARAWYYTEIFADPQDPETVYVLNAPMLRSIDGGRNFVAIPNPHGDQHDLWINPENPQNMILGNDGGACISFNGGQSWSPQDNQPTAQFYRVIADNRFPYYVYGGQQDNSTMAIKSRTDDNGIGRSEWYPVAGGESAFLAFDPNQPDLVYGGSYQGNLSVYDHRTGVTKDIMAYPNVGLASLPSDMKYRFNWNAPLITSPQDRSILYHGANRVLQSTNGGFNWIPISPDLTRNNKERQGLGGAPYTNEGAGGENYNTLSYLAASPHQSGVIWAGSDDGLLHLTRDGGENWQNITPPGMEETLINSIELSPHDSMTAFVVMTRYKFNDFRPMVYRTTDFGQTWTKIVQGIRNNDFVRVVREDPKRPGLLYAGSETGLYISPDQGRNWQRFQLNLPVCPINDLYINQNDLIAATSGRGFWILDDLSSIQQSAGRMFNGQMELFAPRATPRYPSANGRESDFQGQNPLSGVIIDYFLPTGADSLRLDLDILDDAGRVIRSYASEKDKSKKPTAASPSSDPLLPQKTGLNRFNWNMRRAAIPRVPGLFVFGNHQGNFVPPGEYRIRLRTATDTLEQTLRIQPDPRFELADKYYEEQSAFLHQIESTVRDIHESVLQFRDLRTQLQAITTRLQAEEVAPAVAEEADSLIARITAWENNLVQEEQKTFQDVINFPNRLNAELLNLMSRAGGIDPRVTAGARARLQDLLSEWEKHRLERDRILDKAVPAFNRLYRENDLGGVIVPER